MEVDEFYRLKANKVDSHPFFHRSSEVFAAQLIQYERLAWRRCQLWTRIATVLDENKINLQLKQWRSLFTTNSVAKLGVRIGYAEQRTPLNFYGRRGGSPLCLLSNDKTRRLSWMCDNENKIDLLLKQWRALFTTDIIPYASRLNWVSWQANTSDILREKGWESTKFAVKRWNSSTFMNLWW